MTQQFFTLIKCQPMSPQCSENMLIEMYVEVDDLHKAYIEWRNPKMMGRPRRPTRNTGLIVSEVVTILAAYHVSGYKCFEYYYRECILGSYLPLFPQAPSYQRFVSYTARAITFTAAVGNVQSFQSHAYRLLLH